jgi:hypothetical protein
VRASKSVGEGEGSGGYNTSHFTHLRPQDSSKFHLFDILKFYVINFDVCFSRFTFFDNFDFGIFFEFFSFDLLSSTF